MATHAPQDDGTGIGPSWYRSPPAIGIGRFLGAGAIAVFFIVVLMAAAAQSQASRKLANIAGEPIDFSVGYSRFRDVTTAARASPASRRALEALRADADRAQLHVDETMASAGDDAARLRTTYAELEERGMCRSPLPAASPPPGELATLVAAFRQCAQTLQTHATATTARAAADEAEKSLIALRTALKAARAATERHALAARQVDGLENDWREARQIREAFAEADVMRSRWYFGYDLLVAMPPVMLQLLVAFASGLFGGLLLTLILIVYPDNGFNFLRSDSGFGKRIFLGGLIAISVFIVLGSGTAVLGTANAFSDGSANYFALSAIGILAGMFSDRVARWLSKHADVFFESEKEKQADRDALRLAAARKGAGLPNVPPGTAGSTP
jgi:hypothetical protein